MLTAASAHAGEIHCELRKRHPLPVRERSRERVDAARGRVGGRVRMKDEEVVRGPAFELPWKHPDGPGRASGEQVPFPRPGALSPSMTTRMSAWRALSPPRGRERWWSRAAQDASGAFGLAVTVET